MSNKDLVARARAMLKADDVDTKDMLAMVGELAEQLECATAPDDLPTGFVSVIVKRGDHTCERWVSEIAARTSGGVNIAADECWSVICAFSANRQGGGQ